MEADARAADLRPSLVVRDELAPGGRGRRPSSAGPAPAFDLLGLHWRGRGEVWFRAGRDGRLGPWRRAVEHERADPGSGEGGADGWRLGTPVWLPGSTAVEYRVSPGIEAVRAHYVASPRAPLVRREPASAIAPVVIPREAWGADESIVRADPAYADRLRFAVVHHTAGELPVAPEESAALVRAIQRYHVEGNGWNDIGYNFLLDGFGQIFEGRRGGIDRNVIGAHALGFNTGSVGVAVLGNFERQAPPPGVHPTLVSLLAWRLDVGHVDPLALVDVVSTTGVPRTVRAISGHRDVGSTACPGKLLYPSLDAVAQEVAATGLPKLYDPLAEVLERTVRFTARLSEPLSWTVVVTAQDGAEVGRGGGAGAYVDWTWDATVLPDGGYAWRIDAGPSVTPAAGTVTIGAAPAVVEPPPRPPRPSGLPRRIPRWAWQLRTWHKTPRAIRGPRPPGTPRRLPRWYWSWFNWLSAVERWQRDWG